MLQINVSQLLKAPIGTTQSLEVADAVAIMDGEGRVKGEVALMRIDRGILVRGRLNSEVEATCCRCLNLFSCPVTINIEEEYFPTTDVVSGLPLSRPEEADGFTIDGHHILDLTEAIRQYVILAIPMKPLCRQDCAGVKPGS